MIRRQQSHRQGTHLTISTSEQPKLNSRRPRQGAKAGKGLGSKSKASSDASSAALPHKFKTEMCRNFQGPEGCKYGDKCNFAHSERELERYKEMIQEMNEVKRSVEEQQAYPSEDKKPLSQFVQSEGKGSQMNANAKLDWEAMLSGGAVNSKQPKPVYVAIDHPQINDVMSVDTNTALASPQDQKLAWSKAFGRPQSAHMTSNATRANELSVSSRKSSGDDSASVENLDSIVGDGEDSYVPIYKPLLTHAKSQRCHMPYERLTTDAKKPFPHMYTDWLVFMEQSALEKIEEEGSEKEVHEEQMTSIDNLEAACKLVVERLDIFKEICSNEDEDEDFDASEETKQQHITQMSIKSSMPFRFQVRSSTFEPIPEESLTTQKTSYPAGHNPWAALKTGGHSGQVRHASSNSNGHSFHAYTPVQACH